ncbi:glutathione-dependent formaldehyde-activating protein [Advenella kashmirensis WT001]|uniref:Glutathione-dependent formaldehyde-activating protein n=1 Tax=Advenella kashmirensis (strain DSM 17095 / LMG 22695 / WT001) TaxID=1036672 RepID=I3UCA9_ADVKW|nr:GFA family protein [Advenella kashmirensis]AFK62647.1 glutathione-dependent formaldehyde-activating protein [Advenella kashmirensis WT001]
MSYLGSCHCGTVTFTVNAEIPSQAISCNCSICRRTGSLLTFVPADQFELNSGNDQLKTYEFNKHKIQHQFCQRCGIQSFSSGLLPDGTRSYAVNLRCVPEADLDALELQHFDGASA